MSAPVQIVLVPVPIVEARGNWWRRCNTDPSPRIRKTPHERLPQPIPDRRLLDAARRLLNEQRERRALVELERA
jgi:hypothetical protein